MSIASRRCPRSLDLYVGFRFAHVIELLEPRVLLSQTIQIVGTQSAALDQPQVHVFLRTTPDGDPLSATGDDTAADIQAYLDTGTSGVLLSQETASALGITGDTYNGQEVQFTDVGIGGTQPFDVSDPLYGAMAPYTSLFTDDIPISSYTQTFGPTRLELNTEAADDLIGPIDIMGMSTMAGKVMVLDPSALAATDPDDLDSLRTYLYSPGTPFDADNASTDPGIPTTNLHVKLSYADFTDYTTLTPDGAPGPTLGDNPFIGPDPLSSAPSDVPGITIAQGSQSATGSFLFDTGAGASFISTAMAAQVGVQYQPGTYDTDNPVLVDSSGNPLPNQFVIPLGGIGGSVNAAGFYLSSLTLQTEEGSPIEFDDAPVLVADVSAMNSVTGQTITLDGDFGMNFLVPSIDVSGLDDDARTAPPTNTPAAFPADSVTAGSDAPFDWITYDQPNGVLGLDIPGITVTPTPTLPAGVTASDGADYTYDTTSNTLSLNSGTLTFTDDVGSPSSEVLNVTADGSNSNILFNSTEHLDSLTLTDGATATLSQSGSNTVTGSGSAATLVSYGTTLNEANTKVLVLNSLSIPPAGATLSDGATNTAQGTLDLTNNSMILNYTSGAGSSNLAAADALVQSGSDNGIWDGTGITSSNAEADANANGYTAIGVADNGDLQDSSFAGETSLTGNQILFKYTWYGDQDLDGKNTNSDLLLFEAGMPSGGAAGTGWEYGQLDYSAAAPNNADFLLFENGLAGYKQFGEIN